MPIGWNGLNMPSEGCSLCMPIAIINFKVRGVNKTVPYMIKIIHRQALSLKDVGSTNHNFPMYSILGNSHGTFQVQIEMR